MLMLHPRGSQLSACVDGSELQSEMVSKLGTEIPWKLVMWKSGDDDFGVWSEDSVDWWPPEGHVEKPKVQIFFKLLLAGTFLHLTH